MNALIDAYGSRGLTIIGTPCNQFGLQEPCKEHEILLSLKHVRPGKGYEPKFQLTSKMDVNGDGAHPMWVFLRTSLQDAPLEPASEKEPSKLTWTPRDVFWEPIMRYDVGWNFEKFLVDKEGRPVKRYSKGYPTADIAHDIEALL